MSAAIVNIIVIINLGIFFEPPSLHLFFVSNDLAFDQIFKISYVLFIFNVIRSVK